MICENNRTPPHVLPDNSSPDIPLTERVEVITNIQCGELSLKQPMLLNQAEITKF